VINEYEKRRVLQTVRAAEAIVHGLTFESEYPKLSKDIIHELAVIDQALREVKLKVDRLPAAAAI
jgi:hypothetical protein